MNKMLLLLLFWFSPVFAVNQPVDVLNIPTVKVSEFPCGVNNPGYTFTTVKPLGPCLVSDKDALTELTQVRNYITEVRDLTSGSYDKLVELVAEAQKQTAAAEKVKTSVEEQTKKVEEQTKEIKAQSEYQKAISLNTATMVNIQAGTNALVATTNATLEKTNAALTEIKDAALHKGVKVNLGSCVEQDALDKKLPKVTTIDADTLLTGFSCTGDEFLCAQTKLAAIAHCREVIAQRLQTMYLNGSNVFITCDQGYVPIMRIPSSGPLSSTRGVPTCQYEDLNRCASAGTAGQASGRPQCYYTPTVTCPSQDFTPIVVNGGFSCDTILNAGKFNAEISALDRIISAVSDTTSSKIAETISAPLDQALPHFTEDTNMYHEAFKSGVTNYDALGLRVTASTGQIDSFFSSQKSSYTVLGYTFNNDLLDYGKSMYDWMVKLFPNPLLFFTAGGSCNPVSQSFSQLGVAATQFTGGQAVPEINQFGQEICNTWVPIARAFLTIVLSYWVAIYIYRSAVQMVTIALGHTEEKTVVFSSSGHEL